MGIYIKGMEMPKCCCCCPCFNDEYCYCQAADMDLGRIKIESRHPDCPLIGLPPHGRLIDADAIPYKKIMYEDDEFYYGVTMPYIDRMPTVIPADKDGET